MEKPYELDEWVHACKTLKNMPYVPYVAIAELIDNSSEAIDQMERNSFGQIDIILNNKDKTLEIFDNGIGFTKETRGKLNQYGTTKEKIGSRNRYNVGMKNAIYWLGNEFEILSYDRQEGKTYYSSVKLNVNDCSGDVLLWKVKETDQFYGTKIKISQVRDIASNIQIFERDILDQIKEVFRNDLLKSKYKLNAYYISPDGSKHEYLDIKPSIINFQTDDEGIEFLRTKKIEDPITKDSFILYYQIMSKDTKDRLKRSGFHVYYKDRKIASFSVPEVLNSNTNIYKRTYAQIIVDSPNTQLSFLKDDLSIDLSTRAFLFHEIKELFNQEIKPFFDQLSKKEKEGKTKKNREKPEKDAIINDLEDEITFSYKGRDINFDIVRNPNYHLALKIEKLDENLFCIYIRDDLASDENIKIIIYTTLVKEYNFDDLSDLLENGVLS